MGGAGVGFVRSIGAVRSSVAEPVRGNAAATGATELALGTCGCRTVCRALITHVSTIVVSIAQIRARDADVGGLALGLLGLTGSLRAILFIRGPVVVTVVDAIAHVLFGNAASVAAGELRVGVTGSEQAAVLVAVVSAVVVMVTAVVVRHTASISTSEDSGVARVKSTHSLELIAAVSTVVVIVAFPLGTDAAAVHTGELARLAASPVVPYAVFVVSQIPTTL